MKKILVIDDELDFRELFQELLTDEGFDVELAVDGEDAFTKIVKGGYDLILMDILMPKMDGMSTLKKLKQTKVQKTNGPIVMLSVLEGSEFVKKCNDLGAKGFINKSLGTPDDLVNEIKKFL